MKNLNKVQRTKDNVQASEFVLCKLYFVLNYGSSFFI